MSGRTLIFDIETHSADLLYTLKPEEFFRLGGYAWDDGPVVLTTDIEELEEQIRQARCIIGHNIHAFDLKAIFGAASDEPLELSMQKRVYDTWVHASLVNPAPSLYQNRHGQTAKGDKPEQLKRWFGLDEQAFQLGVPGKTHDLRELAREFGPDGETYEYVDPSSGVVVRSLHPLDKAGAGYGMIPVDDPRYRDYLIGDVEASRYVAKALLKLGPLNDYAMREQEVAARAAIISSNGFKLNQPKARARVEELRVRRDEILSDLQNTYGLPTTGDAPWDTTEGKAAIMAALADHGITPESRPDWPKTPVWDKRDGKVAESRGKANALYRQVMAWSEEIESGGLPARSIAARERWIERDSLKAKELRDNPLPVAFGLSLGGEALINLTAGTDAEDLGQALAELKGQRSLAQLALDSVHPDGFVHPNITMLQRSGRWSATEPGLTVWTSRGEGAVEKSYFDPDYSDEVLIGLDYSNADARGVAAMSGDKEYSERFLPGADGHMINAIAAWGKEVVDTDPKKYRQMAKAPGHGWNYSLGAEKAGYLLGAKTKEEAKKIGGAFIAGMDSSFKGVTAWKKESIRKAQRQGYLLTEWGRKLWVEKGREFTQAPALLGQNGTREIVCDALLRMPPHVLRRVKAQIHDEIIFSVPRRNWEECRDYLIKIMETSFKPAQGGQLIDFPVSSGPAGENWMEATHE